MGLLKSEKDMEFKSGAMELYTKDNGMITKHVEMVLSGMQKVISM